MEGERLDRLPLRENLAGQGLILVTLGLMALGAVMVYSTAGAVGPHLAWYYRLEVRQILFVAVALGILATVWRVDYRWLARRPWEGRGWLGRVPSPSAILLVVSLAAAAAVLVLGHEVRGRVRAFRVGPVGFQPAEVVKFAVLIFLAAFLSRTGGRHRSFWRTFVPGMGLIGLSVGLVVKQDFDTAALIGAAGVAVMLMGGVPWYYFLLLIPPCWVAYDRMIRSDPYRWGRIEAMLNPYATTNPAAYQPRQSLIAISTGAEPAGPGGGIAKYGYLPEHSSDYIFSPICEELGLAGAALVVGLMLVWLYLTWRASTRAGDRFGALLAGGLGFLVCLQASLHLAVAVNLAPPTGTALPFVSYGGSSLLMMALAAALMVSVTARPAPLGAGPPAEGPPAAAPPVAQAPGPEAPAGAKRDT